MGGQITTQFKESHRYPISEQKGEQEINLKGMVYSHVCP